MFFDGAGLRQIIFNVNKIYDTAFTPDNTEHLDRPPPTHGLPFCVIMHTILQTLRNGTFFGAFGIASVIVSMFSCMMCIVHDIDKL